LRSERWLAFARVPAAWTSHLLTGWRRLRALPWLRSATSSGPPAEVIAVLAYSRVVQSPLRFVAAQLLHRGRPSVYRIRGAGPAVCVRDGTADIYSLAQVFADAHAELPARVVDALRSIDRPIEVLDLGGNVGAWGASLAARVPVGRMTSFEPDPGNAAVLRRTIRANAREATWTVVEACAAPGEGTVSFRAEGSGLSRIGEGPGAIQVAAHDVFPALDRVDLAKIDIEGGEWALLGDPRFAALRCPVISLEYHPRLRPAPEGAALARAALQSAGYEVIEGPGAGPDTGVLWGVR
jgi:FkbM family methyltransferase